MTTFDMGDRVMTPHGAGTVVYRRMAPPSYAEPAAYSVKLDKFPTHTGAIYQASEVRLLSAGMP